MKHLPIILAIGALAGGCDSDSDNPSVDGDRGPRIDAGAADAGAADAGPTDMSVGDASPAQDAGVTLDATVRPDALAPDLGPPEPCGNGVVDGRDGEHCDDGNADDTDGCRADCRFAQCGDGITQRDAPVFELYADFEDGFPEGTQMSPDPWVIAPDGLAGTMAAHANHHGQLSIMTIGLTTQAPGVLRFRFSVGQETLRVSIDGMRVASPSGDFRWSLEEYALDPGEHEIQFVCDDGRQDTFRINGCWIDDLFFIRDAQATEACDDGNTQDGDGCSAECQAE